MMVKLLGAVTVLCISGFIGFSKAFELKRRVAVLEGLCTAFMHIENDISFLSMPLDMAFSRAAVCDKSGILARASQLVLERPAYEAMKCAAVGRNGLMPEDVDILMEYAQGLEAPDIKGQMQNISLAKKRLDYAREQAYVALNKSFKIYCTGGLSLGAVVVIVLI